MNVDNPYLCDQYQPVDFSRESTDWVRSEVMQGVVPRHINGHFLRNSSNPRFEPSGADYHWFDGDGFIQGVRFENGEVFYKGRFVRTKKFMKEELAQRSLYGGLNGLVNRDNLPTTLWHAVRFLLSGRNPLPNTSNTDLVFHNGRLISSWMLGGIGYEIDIDTLETKGPFAIPAPTASEGMVCKVSAHARVHPANGSLYTMDFVHSWKRFSRPAIEISAIDADHGTVTTRRVRTNGKHLLHDLAVTGKHVVVLDMPSEVTALGLRYNKRKATRFGLMRSDFGKAVDPRTNREEDVLWFDDPSGCYLIHMINAYDDGNTVVVLGLRKPMLATTAEEAGSTSEVFDAYLHRWVLDLSTGRIHGDTGESLVEHFPISSEFPTINENFVGRRNRYSYLPGISTSSRFCFDRISKYDHELKTYSTRPCLPGTYLSEVRFVPHPEFPEVEDKGWLLGFHHDARSPSMTTSIEILDAQDIAGERVAKIELPHPLPIGFHTVYVDDAERGVT